MVERQSESGHLQPNVYVAVPDVLQHALGLHSVLDPVRRLSEHIGSFGGTDHREGTEEAQVTTSYRSL